MLTQFVLQQWNSKESANFLRIESVRNSTTPQKRPSTGSHRSAACGAKTHDPTLGVVGVEGRAE